MPHTPKSRRTPSADRKALTPLHDTTNTPPSQSCTLKREAQPLSSCFQTCKSTEHLEISVNTSTCYKVDCIIFASSSFEPGVFANAVVASINHDFLASAIVQFAVGLYLERLSV